MSLAKIPILLSSTLAACTAVTPPQPQVPASQRAKNISTFERIFSAVSKQHSQGANFIFCATGLLEATVILATKYPRHPISQKILEFLVNGPPSLATRITISPMFVAGSCLAALGGIIRYQCYRTLGRFFTFEVTIRDDHQLITSGPYAYVRHPSYTGWIATIVGINVCHASAGSWLRECRIFDTVVGKVVAGLCLTSLTIATLAFVRRAPLEDALLRKRFGKQWDEWAEKVRYRMVPYIY